MKNRLKVVISNPISIREKVYEAIRNDILNGLIAPGERMIETRLASQIKTSRTPVREALHMLEREGLLEAIPRVGYRVKALRQDEVEEICEIRRVNETLAAHWAMERITARELQALEENLFHSEAEVRRGNPKSFVDLDAEFHEILARASGSERLQELCQLLRRHMLRYRIESIFMEENVLQAIMGHRCIFECIKGKDPVGVEQAIKRHLETSKNDILKHAFGSMKRRGNSARGIGI